MWFPQTPNGDYIVEAGDKLIFTNGDYVDPSISDVIVFDESLEPIDIDYGKEIIWDAAQRTKSSKEFYKAVEDMLGEEFVRSRENGFSSTNKRSQNSTGKRKSSRGALSEVDSTNGDEGISLSSNKTIPKGENPARDIDVPAKDKNGGKVSRGVRTVLEAKATPDSYVSPIMADVQPEYCFPI